MHLASRIGFISLLLLTGCERSATSLEPQPATALKSGIELAYLDTQVKPQNDFFRHVNGNWLAKTEIPADKASWGSFSELRHNAEKNVLELVRQQAIQRSTVGSDAQKIGDLFLSYLDTARLNTLGLTPLHAELNRIDQLTESQQLPNVWGQLQAVKYGAPLEILVVPDQKNSTAYIPIIRQAGLGLPDRDYYLQTDEQAEKIKQQYRWMIARFWELAGWPHGDEAAKQVFAVEKQLAQLQWSRVQNRDRTATYNKMTVAELHELAPEINWKALLQSAGVPESQPVVVRQPSYLRDLAKLSQQISVEQWRLYLKFHVLQTYSPYLSTAFSDARFDFYGRVLAGLQQQKPREEQAIGAVNDALGFMVGKMYVEKYFTATAQARMQQMIFNLRQAFAEAIPQLDWMSAATKQQALAKLSKLNTKIGYPEKWRDYSCLTIQADDLVGNMQRSFRCEYARELARLDKPVDKTEWGMTPQTVNAYYSSTLNEIVFPAAILQPPFFNVAADDAVNYGAIGAVIGHEITHGFDDQGRRSDGDGNLTDWWTEADAEQFKRRAQLMVEQYDAFTPIDDLHLQGALGLGENIADLGGLTMAFRAYHNSLGGKPAPVIDGFTGDKRFFIGWAQVWRIKYRPQALRQQVITGPHAPGMYRVQGVLSNMPEFYQTYHVKSGDGMYRPPAVRVKIW